MSELSFNIGAVERDTGLSKDVLRVWERRYGFPAPLRDANGERCYPLEQVERLRMIKRLMDQGHRPGKLMEASVEELAERAARQPQPAALSGSTSVMAELAELIAMIKRHDASAYLQAMQQQLARKGLEQFVQDIVAPLSNLVGEEWEGGTLQVFEEHLFTELTTRLLRQAIASFSGGGQLDQLRPCVLLTSVPGEQHALGLLMAETILTLEGGRCIPLGTGTPLLDIAQAAAAHRADIVGLSFSSAFPQQQISDVLKQLRKLLPAEVGLWAGGSGVQKLSAIEGVQLLPSLINLRSALASWRGEGAG